MRFVSSSFQPWSRAFVGINNTSVFCLAFPNIAVGFSTALFRYVARHCCWHRNFQLPSGFDHELEFFIFWFDEAFSSQLSGIVELWFLDSPSLFCFLFLAASGVCFHMSGHIPGLSFNGINRFLCHAHVMQMSDNRRWKETHVTVELQREASSGPLGEDTRVAHVIGSAKSNWRERSRCHEESEWSLIISLMCPFCLPQRYGAERSFKRIRRSCLS